jgi:hypothetical protein
MPDSAAAQRSLRSGKYGVADDISYGAAQTLEMESPQFHTFGTVEGEGREVKHKVS